MKRKITFIIALLLVCVFYADAAVTQSSPWEHSSAEVGVSAPVVIPGTNPLTYSTSTFSRERELYGYYPRFKPNIVTFDYYNRPYIYVGKLAGEDPLDNTFRETRGEFADKSYIQTLDTDGNWIVVDLEKIVETLPENGSFTSFDFYSGIFAHINRVTFDSSGGVYFTAIELPFFNSTAQSHRRRFFGGSVYDLENWTNVAVGNASYALETPEAFTSAVAVPSFMRIGTTDLELFLINNTGSGLAVVSSVIIGEGIGTGAMHSGKVNASVTLGNYIHIVYLDAVNLYGEDETGQYYMRYNKITEEFSSPVFLGTTAGLASGGVPDGHNAPVLTVGIDRALHVVMGAHGMNPMKYTYSTDNGNTWSTPIEVVQDATYPSLAVTPDGTLHLVTRRNSTENGEFKYRLWYSRKQLGLGWEDMGAIVEPYRNGYGIYYHKLTADRLGNLYLSFSYLASDLSTAEQQEHEAKWPGETPGEFAHDTSILTSKDNGNSWILATTADFVGNIVSLTAYYSFDNSQDIAADYSGNNNHLQTNNTSPPDYTSNGVFGGAAVFNGIDQGFDLRRQDSNPPIYPEGSFTVATWAKPASNIGTGLYAITRPVSNNGGFIIYIDNGTYRFGVYPTGTHVNSGIVATNKWAHLALIFSAEIDNGDGTYSGIMSCYVNGEFAGSSTISSYNPNIFRFGLGNKAYGGDYFKGEIDEFAIFSGALAESKIAALAEKLVTADNVLYPVMLKGDINMDGVVNQADLAVIAENWLVSE